MATSRSTRPAGHILSDFLDYIGGTLLSSEALAIYRVGCRRLRQGASTVYLRAARPVTSLFSGNSDAPARCVNRRQMHWHTVQRPGDGFKVDLPADDKDLQVPAFNETGGAEPVNMVVANPTRDVTYAVTWEDNPPVARVNHSIDRILNMARDGMLARTETTIVSESRGFQRGYPSLDFLARNTAGGVLNARLVVGRRTALRADGLVSVASARSERDVNRFFNSLVPSHRRRLPKLCRRFAGISLAGFAPSSAIPGLKARPGHPARLEYSQLNPRTGCGV